MSAHDVENHLIEAQRALIAAAEGIEALRDGALKAYDVHELSEAAHKTNCLLDEVGRVRAVGALTRRQLGLA